MVKVNAKALPIDYQYPHGSDVLRIEYSLGNLTVYVEGLTNDNNTELDAVIETLNRKPFI